jgi:purine-cytosine permease-like protein
LSFTPAAGHDRLVSVTALNMYGGSLTLISAVDSFKRVRPTLSARVVTVAFTAALSLIGALAATQNFLGNFNNFLLLVLYLFVPVARHPRLSPRLCRHDTVLQHWHPL